jgi:hypothetical protein
MPSLRLARAGRLRTVGERENRLRRLQDLLEERRYRDAVVGAAEQLSRLLDVPVVVDQALPSRVVEVARAAYLSHERSHLVWRRVWGVHLREEMRELARRVGELAPGSARLVWMSISGHCRRRPSRSRSQRERP